MAGSLTLIALMCLVLAVVLLSVRNSSLRSSMTEERHLSLKSLDEKAGELDVCRNDIIKKQEAIGDLEKMNQKIHDEKTNLGKEAEKLRSEITDKNHLAVVIEELNAELTMLKENSIRQQNELDSALQQVSALTQEKDNLVAELEEALKKTVAAETGQKNALPPPKLPAAKGVDAAVVEKAAEAEKEEEEDKENEKEAESAEVDPPP
ncbi:hypothetical protein SK128_020851 [Halocaridina rubra]|uniref:Uncharacterized protein n=1 Tax=Halocaridina rubra TaxID=373956 RepID=A0AAN8WIT3_HALRR